MNFSHFSLKNESPITALHLGTSETHQQFSMESRDGSEFPRVLCGLKKHTQYTHCYSNENSINSELKKSQESSTQLFRLVKI